MNEDQKKGPRFIEHYFRMYDFSENDGTNHRQRLLGEMNEMVRHMILANIPPNYYSYMSKDVIDVWSKDTANDESIDAYEAYLVDLDDLCKDGVGIYFSGSHGLAKTTASIVILKRALQLNRTAYFITMSDLVEFITSGWKDSVQKAKYQYIISNVDFLVIDDIGRNFKVQNDLATTFLDKLFVARSNNKKPTIMTSNHHISSDSGLFGESLLTLFKSSLFEIKVFGDDIRQNEISKSLAARIQLAKDKRDHASF